jgi:hypothetical protein
MELLLWWLGWAGGCAFVDQVDRVALVVVEGTQEEWPLPLPEGALVCGPSDRPRPPRPRPPRRELPLQTSLDALKEPPHAR